MKFSILLPTLGTREYELNRLFDSLKKQEFTDFEIVVVSQINHNAVIELIKAYPELNVIHIKLEKKGISYARNQGLEFCSGDWILLSDDDAWYPQDGLKLLNEHTEKEDADIILTQIFDPDKNQLYKVYSEKEEIIKSKFKLMSKSSIEIAVKRDKIKEKFDEDFGVGAKYVCCEEVDFLINHFTPKRVKYIPIISVFHLKKEGGASPAQQLAKGAFYAKQFNRFIAVLIDIRDILKRRHPDRKMFWKGFNDYRSARKQCLES